MTERGGDIIDLIEKLKNPMGKITETEQILLNVIKTTSTLSTNELIDTIQTSQWCQNMVEDQSFFSKTRASLSHRAAP